jgi:NitT/TauT family transport system permease protein
MSTSTTDAPLAPGTRAGPADARSRGIAASPAFRAYLARRRRERLLVLGGQLALLVGLLVAWELSARRVWVDPLLTSSPARVLETMHRLIADGSLLHHTGVTALETVVGFAAGMSLGLLVATAIWWSPLLSRILEPYLVVANALPKIALGPIFYVWAGDRFSVYVMAIAISVIVTIVMVHTGFMEVDPSQIKLLRTFGASQWQILRKVVVPASVPTIIGALKVNVGLTLVGVIVGEFLAAKAGLGFLIIYGSQVFQMELVMTSIVMLVMLSVVLYMAVTWIESRAVRWYR